MELSQIAVDGCLTCFGLLNESADVARGQAMKVRAWAALVTGRTGIAIAIALMVWVGMSGAAKADGIAFFSGTITPFAGGLYEYQYSASNGASGFTLATIELPELHSGDFLLGSGAGSPVLPQGWSASEIIPADASPGFTAGALVPAADVILQAQSGSGIPEGGGPVIFDLFSIFGASIDAQALLSGPGGGGPDLTGTLVPASSIPEPIAPFVFATAVLTLGVARRWRRR